ncbi:MAG: NUDIX hydrolase [Pyrinomonadaceae bacterium]|nr:NUDIX hydrolase [Pyrinomonadaceae bacterium]
MASCRVFDVQRYRCTNESTGAQADFFVIENPDWVNIIPVTEDGKIVLIRQFRHGTESVTLEIPGGLIDENETPEECAFRELEEETGYRPFKMVYLGRSHPNPALQENWIYHFAALGCEKSGKEAFDEHESIENHLVDEDSIEDLISNEVITHSLVIAGFSRFAAYKRRATGYSYES